MVALIAQVAAEFKNQAKQKLIRMNIPEKGKAKINIDKQIIRRVLINFFQMRLNYRLPKVKLV